MLQTSGLALNDTDTATLAAQLLQDSVHNAQTIASAMPSLVIDLSDGLELNQRPSHSRDGR